MKIQYLFYLLIFTNTIIIYGKQTPQLPNKLKIGYAKDYECDEKIFEAVKNGLNVVIWFQLNLASNEDGSYPIFQGGPDYSCVAKMVKRFKDNGYSVINLISAGGWNSPHVNTDFTAEQYFKEWIKFNEKISSEENEFYGFDGIDWDIEGNDDKQSSHNYFTYKELDIIGEFSVLLKKEGYLVTMVPPESYLDPSTTEFSLSLLHNYPEWEKEVPDFTYHARNVYAYLIAKFSLNTFDFVSVQLYEGYAHALYKYEREKISLGEIMYELVTNLTKGFIVDFSKDENSGMDKKIIKIPEDKITIGLANGWASGKFLFVNEKDIVEGYKYLKDHNKDVRGFFFWDIYDEGNIPLSDNADEKSPFYLAKILNSIM